MNSSKEASVRSSKFLSLAFLLLFLKSVSLPISGGVQHNVFRHVQAFVWLAFIFLCTVVANVHIHLHIVTMLMRSQSLDLGS